VECGSWEELDDEELEEVLGHGMSGGIRTC
jgi:hypothetical protein